MFNSGILRSQSKKSKNDTNTRTSVNYCIAYVIYENVYHVGVYVEY